MVYMTSNQSTACGKPHRYTVEVAGHPARYAGADQAAAVSALNGIDIDGGEEGWVVAEHVTRHATVHCPGESNRLELLAMGAGDLAAEPA
jgi:hypothetical protein